MPARGLYLEKVYYDKNDDAKEYIKELEELSFGYATIIGHVIPRGITPIIVH